MNSNTVLNNYIVRTGYRLHLIKQPSSDHQNMQIKYYKEIKQHTDNIVVGVLFDQPKPVTSSYNTVV
jgi:hypothetical protein